MATSVTEYNVTLGSESPVFNYRPLRDSDASQGWNASYTGSPTYVNSLGSGTAFRRTQNDGAQIVVDFEGTGLYLYYTAEGASCSLSIDGAPAGAVVPASGTFCSGLGADSVLVAGGLGYGSHEAVLDVTIPSETASFLFYEGIVTVSAGVAGSLVSPLAPTYIDDRDAGWTWSPSPASWTVHTSNTDGDYAHTRTGLCRYSASSSAAYTFSNASAVVLMGGVANESFGYTIMLDGVSSTYNATNFWNSPSQVLFFQGGLDPDANHTIIATNYDVDQPDPPGDRACFNIDALGLVNSIPPVTTPGAASSSSRPAIVGGVVGGVILLLVLAGLAVWWRRRRARRYVNVEGQPETCQQDATPAPFMLSTAVLHFEERRKKGASSYTPRAASSSARPNVPPLVLPSSPPSSRQSDTRGATHADLQQTPTADLVEVLNERLRQQPMRSADEAPPMYAPQV